MKIFNTLTREKQEFVPIEKGKAKIYACGPTVYNYIHIGNARPLCVFDVLRRYLEWRGYDVTFVQNFTDIDDKLIKKANEEGITVPEVAKRYIEEFWVDAKGLNIREAQFHPKATENIEQIIAIISSLMEKGYAYKAGNDIYYRAKMFKEYGKLSHQPLDELEAGARISDHELKEDPMDFCLWKGAKPGEPFWHSPFGDGRPGWHIECSAMAGRYLGKTIDIHCGGLDLIFPHHENEIAQSEAANGCEFSHYWMHNGFINVDNHKMSKSLNNFFTVRDVANEFGYEPIRYLMISSQYRSPINYSIDIIKQAKNAIARLYTLRDRIDFELKNNKENGEIPEFADKRKDEFIAAMEDDLNTADALGVVFSFAKDINLMIDKGTNRDALNYCAKVFDELTYVLGLLYNRKEDTLDSEVEALIEERTNARKNKDYKKADEIRDKLKEMGITLEDTKDGVKWTKN